MDDIYFMKLAINEATIAFDKGEVPVGAVVVCNNTIVARSHNLTETLSDITAHAEILSITSASNYLGGKYLTNCTLYVTLEPCIMCAGALAWSQVSKIVYGATDPKHGFSLAGYPILHPKTEVTKGVLEHECGNILKKFFRKLRPLQPPPISK